MRVLRVGVAGLGNVGREAVRLLRSSQGRFSRELGARLELAWVCDRGAAAEARRLGLPASVRRERRWQKALGDPSVELVVEVFGGAGEARALVLGALRAGKHVVTANKRLLADHWEEVFAAAARAGRRVHFEAAVAGGIPVVQALRTGLAANRIQSVVGILNGTTNFMLSYMAHGRGSYASALAEAQRLGMAEKDPTLDLNGTDSADKVSVLAALVTGRRLPPGRIPRQGIEGVEDSDLAFAASHLGRSVRLLGSLTVDWRGGGPTVEAHVRPCLVPVDHPLAAVHGGYNAVLVSASSAGDLLFYGQGAGPGPAASAVLGDVLMLGREILAAAPSSPLPPGPEARGGPALRLKPESAARFYLRLSVRDVPGALAKLAAALGREEVSIASLHQDQGAAGRAVVRIVTHRVARARLDRARQAIDRLREVGPGSLCLRYWG